MSALDLDLLSEYLDGDQNEYGLDFAATHGFYVLLRLARSLIAGLKSCLIIITRKCQQKLLPKLSSG